MPKIKVATLEQVEGENSSGHEPREEMHQFGQALPTFEEKYAAAFFISFEKVAEQLKWPQEN